MTGNLCESAGKLQDGSARRQSQIAQMQEVLRTKRDALVKSLAGDLALLNVVRPGSSSGDVVDNASDGMANEISLQLAESGSEELARIEWALEQIREDMYGICVGCDNKIPIARLNALPYAERCIGCQRTFEHDVEELKASQQQEGVVLWR